MNAYLKVTAIALMAVSSASAFADNYTDALKSIAVKNPALALQAQKIDAQKSANATGLTLANPEGSIMLQGGSPAGVPARTTVELGQSFDFATLSGAKKGVAEARNRAAETSMAVSWRDIVAQTDQQMTEVVYRRRLKSYYDMSTDIVKKIFESAEKSFKAGEINAVELNGFRLQLNDILTQARLNEVELSSALAALSRLGGGEPVSWTGTEYMAYTLPSDFEAWSIESVQRDPLLIAAQGGVDVANSEINLARKEGLPTFSVGYAGEFVQGANYNGVNLGFELPLWANKGKVKAAQAARAAAQAEYDNLRRDIQLQQRNAYDRAATMAKYAQETEKLFAQSSKDIMTSLIKQFTNGQISVYEYLTMTKQAIDNGRTIVDSEHEYQAALAALRALAPAAVQ